MGGMIRHHGCAPCVLAAASVALAGEASRPSDAGAASDWTVTSQPERALRPGCRSAGQRVLLRRRRRHGPDGSIAVADQILGTITVLAGDGGSSATLGREGDGPGEFLRLAGIVADGEGRLVAFDGERQRLSEWTLDGSLVEDTRLFARATTD